MTTTTCTKCNALAPERPRAALAQALRHAVAIATRQEADWTRRFQTLTAHLLWLESELRGLCTNCVLAEAADEFAALSVTVEGACGGAGGEGRAEPGAPSFPERCTMEKYRGGPRCVNRALPGKSLCGGPHAPAQLAVCRVLPLRRPVSFYEQVSGGPLQPKPEGER